MTVHYSLPYTRLASALLLIFLLLTLTGADLPPTSYLGQAPSTPPRSEASPARMPAPVRMILPEQNQKAYLPIIHKPFTGLDIHSRQSSLDFYLDQYLAPIPPPGWTGTSNLCSPGSTSAEFKDAVLRRINFYRLMAGVPPVERFNLEYTLKAQAAALMMSVNQALDHTPPEDWQCYSQDGKEGAGSSNLAAGAYGPAAINLYMSDMGDYNTAVGHRRWILYPQTQEMGTGDIPTDHWRTTTNALYVFDSHLWEARPETRSPFVAWPPEGYVPSPVVFPRWSFSYAGADFSSAAVTVQHAGVALLLTQHSPANGYGENTLVWEFANSSYWEGASSDLAFEVTIRNVLVEDQPQTFTYTVTIFDPNP
jgi:uncharacterized protein YkwD